MAFVRNILILVAIITMNSCQSNPKKDEIRIGFLHHSTGQNIWEGDRSTYLSKQIDHISIRLGWKFKKGPTLPGLFKKYNRNKQTNYLIDNIIFPKQSPYGWNNYPFDYYNIWVKHSGGRLYLDEPTLEILTKKYDVLIIKHCFPVSNINADTGVADIDSDAKSISNYKLQYQALRDKFHLFPGTKFIVFTGAAQIKSNISESEAVRAKEFFKWVTEEWDLPNDNIFIWDLYSLQTEGGIYFKEKYAVSESDPHPNETFSEKVSHVLFNRIIDVIEQNGSLTSLTGKIKP
jgi:hypothetical protein